MVKQYGDIFTVFVCHSVCLSNAGNESKRNHTSPFILETVRDRPIVTSNHKQEVIGSWSMRVGFDDFEWPWKAGQEGHFFPGVSPYVRSYRLTKTTKFGIPVVTHVGRGEFLGCKARHISKGWAVISQKNLQGRPRPGSCKSFETQMLARDLLTLSMGRKAIP